MGDKVVPVKCLLIGGTGRSGSNILKKVISQNQSVFALHFESRFTVDPDGVFSTLRSLMQSVSPFEADLLIDRFSIFLNRLENKTSKDRLAIFLENLAIKTFFRSTPINFRAYKEWELASHFPDYKQEKDILLKHLKQYQYAAIWPAKVGIAKRVENTFLSTDRQAELPIHFSNFLNRVYASILHKHNKQIYLDDNTYNILFAREIMQILPSAHLVHIVRDPRDVVASLSQQRWAPSNIEMATQFYKTTMDQCIKQTEGLSSDQLTILKLEDLCSNTPSVLSNLCSTIGINLTNEMLAVKLNKANSGRWMQDIPKSSHEKINLELNYYIKKFGYKT